MKCIFCHRDHEDQTIEHIVPRSLGNLHYILPRGKVCGSCNNRFAKYEQRVLNSHPFFEERQRLGLIRPTNETIPHDLSAGHLQPFLLKMGYEAIYRSRSRLWKRFEWESVAKMLVEGRELPFLDDQDLSNVTESKSIPRWLNTLRLGNNHMKLLYSTTADDRLFVHFHFGKIRSKCRMC